MANEIELKLRIAAADVPRLQRHPALLRHLHGEPLTRRLTSIYYDTPDLRLLDAALSLRVRHMAGGWFQAVKGAGHALAGLHQRMEWEDIITGSEPEFDKITEPGLAAIFADQTLRSALRPIFVTDVERTEWQLVFADGSAIEAALDLGELRPGTAGDDWPAEHIRELELELKHGKAAHIFELALALQADIPLHIENVNKAQRGYVHFRVPDLPSPPDSTVEGLPAGITASAAFPHLAGRCLQQLQDAQLRLQTRSEREDIATLRLVLDRLRFLLRLFDRQRDELRQSLKRAIALLDAVHDWHVFVHAALPAWRAHLPRDRHALLQGQAQEQLERAWQRLTRWLDSQQYQQLLLQLGARLAAETSRPEPATTLVAAALQRGDRKLRKEAQHWPTADPDRLRKLLRRIDRLSYCAALLKADDVYRSALADLKETLTALHALDLGTGMLQHLIDATTNGADTGSTPDHANAKKRLCERATAGWMALPAPPPAPAEDAPSGQIL